jgi:hypothetical protein
LTACWRSWGLPATDAGQRYAAGCRAAVPDAEHKAAAWALLAESEDLGVEGVFEVTRGFAQPEHVPLLAPYGRQRSHGRAAVLTVFLPSTSTSF